MEELDVHYLSESGLKKVINSPETEARGKVIVYI